MQGIYEGVKTGDIELARCCFDEVAVALAQRHELTTLVLGCTEIPLALSEVTMRLNRQKLRLLDPAVELARALAERAYSS